MADQLNMDFEYRELTPVSDTSSSSSSSLSPSRSHLFPSRRALENLVEFFSKRDSEDSIDTSTSRSSNTNTNNINDNYTNANDERLPLVKDDTILFVFISLATGVLVAIILLIMVYCCLKRRNLYKSTPNDLASLSLSNSATSSSNYNNFASTWSLSFNNHSFANASSNNNQNLLSAAPQAVSSPSSVRNHRQYHHLSSSTLFLNNSASTSNSNLLNSNSISPQQSSTNSPNSNLNTSSNANANTDSSQLSFNVGGSNSLLIRSNQASKSTLSHLSAGNSFFGSSTPCSSSSCSNIPAVGSSATATATTTTATTTLSALSTISAASKLSLKGISISIPVAKPTLNESKPQLSIDSKMKAKTLIERRGSNNSLTLTINPVKKKSISSPSKECSTLEYLSKASHLLTVNELIEISKDNVNLYNEFYYIPANHAELTVPGSSIKNRYKTIVPNESSRVRLPVRNNDPLSSYINANYMSGYKNESKAYIASQGPMSHTISDFWYMIWTECVSCVVMITKLKERRKSQCEMYIPEECDQTNQYENIFVTVKQITIYQDFEVRQILVTQNNETRVVYHYWYTAWPDHNVPEDPNSLIQLIKQVEKFRSPTPTNANDEDMNNNVASKSSPSGAILVHCSAGIGRTGCFIALAIGIKQIDNENLVDIVQIVCRLRRDRGGMIQTLEQYEFIYQVLAYYCIYYKKFPINSTSSSDQSPSMSVSSPSSMCLQSHSSSPSSFSFNINAQTIQ